MDTSSASDPPTAASTGSDLSSQAAFNRNKLKQLSTVELTSALGIQAKQRARRTWTPEEDGKLRMLVAEWGDQRGKNSHWDKISESMDGRTSKDCRKRWFHSLDPTLKRGRWTPDEDRILIEAHESYGPAWNRIAQLIPGRTDDQCSKRYNDVLDPNVQNRLREWTQEEDAQLMRMFKEHGTQWKIIASKMNGRTGLTCRNRWRKLAASSVAKPGKKSSANINTSSSNTPDSTLSMLPASMSIGSNNDPLMDLNALSPESNSSNGSTPNSTISNSAISPVLAFSNPPNINRPSDSSYSQSISHLYGGSALPQDDGLLGQSSLNDLTNSVSTGINATDTLNHINSMTQQQQQQQQHSQPDDGIPFPSTANSLIGLLREAEKTALFQNGSSNTAEYPSNQSSGNNNNNNNNQRGENTSTSTSTHYTFGLDSNGTFSRARRDTNESTMSDPTFHSSGNRRRSTFKSILGKRTTREDEDEEDNDTQSFRREDVETIVQIAKANGVPVVIHQHSYHNHYHHHHHYQGDRDAEDNTITELGAQTSAMNINNMHSMTSGINNNNSMGINSSNHGNNLYPHKIQKTSRASFGANSNAGSLSNILNSTNSSNSKSNTGSGNGVPLLAGGSVSLGIGSRLNDSGPTSGNDNLHTTSHSRNSTGSTANTNSSGESTYLQPHPHFKELEQIDMDTDPFSWIPPFTPVNPIQSLSYEEIPFNPS